MDAMMDELKDDMVKNNEAGKKHVAYVLNTLEDSVEERNSVALDNSDEARARISKRIKSSYAGSTGCDGLQSKTKLELKEMCKCRGKACSGKKETLIARLLQNDGLSLNSEKANVHTSPSYGFKTKTVMKEIKIQSHLGLPLTSFSHYHMDG